MSSTPPVLQVGFGGFGPVHLQAWFRLGGAEKLWVADPDPAARERARRFDLPPERVVADFRGVLGEVEIVDVVASTRHQVGICEVALDAGKDVFVEKPLTLEVEAAMRLEAQVGQTGRVLQVGYYFRHHPLSRWARERVERGALGQLRYFSGNFFGFKRARRDIGVAASDAVHFLDLFSWLGGSFPERVFAARRDHFGRELEDLALIVLEYPDGTLGRVEAGLIQPGRQTDTVMPDALTTKEVQICGSDGAIEIDYQAERLTWHRVHHELRDGLWRPVFGDALTPRVAPAGPVDVVESQLRTFLGHVETRTAPEANVHACGVAIARLLEAIERSANEGRPVDLAR